MLAAQMTAHNTPGSNQYNEFHDPDFKVDLVVNERAEVYFFHNKPFKQTLSWLEFDLGTNNLDVILADGDVRNFGAKVPDRLAKHMQNAYQVMMVQMDEKSGEPMGGSYYPLIIHRA
jgi:hypothetical protein